jgi:class 3 adenylate cyclase
VEAKRRQVVVLFADVVGFSALSERLGEEAAFSDSCSACRKSSSAPIQVEGAQIQSIVGDSGDSVMVAFVAAPTLIERFRGCFPDIYYAIYWETRLMNAQAYIGANGRSVRLYGGLEHHRQVGVEGIAFAPAHETGHHPGGPLHHEFYTAISSEERADEWAEEIGLPAVFGEAVSRRYVRHGVAPLCPPRCRAAGDGWKMSAAPRPESAIESGSDLGRRLRRIACTCGARPWL